MLLASTRDACTTQALPYLSQCTSHNAQPPRWADQEPQSKQIKNHSLRCLSLLYRIIQRCPAVFTADTRRSDLHTARHTKPRQTRQQAIVVTPPRPTDPGLPACLILLVRAVNFTNTPLQHASHCWRCQHSPPGAPRAHNCVHTKSHQPHKATAGTGLQAAAHHSTQHVGMHAAVLLPKPSATRHSHTERRPAKGQLGV
jgi:hypothetical protein